MRPLQRYCMFWRVGGDISVWEVRLLGYAAEVPNAQRPPRDAAACRMQEPSANPAAAGARPINAAACWVLECFYVVTDITPIEHRCDCDSVYVRPQRAGKLEEAGGLENRHHDYALLVDSTAGNLRWRRLKGASSSSPRSKLATPDLAPAALCGPERMATRRLEAPNGVGQSQVSLSRRCRQLRPEESRDTHAWISYPGAQEASIAAGGGLGALGAALYDPPQRGDSMIAGGSS
ncbi:hypothetical protein V8E51_010910 [Hyaloscypha variabilis]